MTRHGDAGEALHDVMHHSLHDAVKRFMTHLLTRSITRFGDADDAVRDSVHDAGR